jgi:Flp pilus assembly protein TadG
MLRIGNQSPHGQRGLAAVETIIALPVLLLLFVATAEVGRGFMQYNTLEKGVRDAARYLAEEAINGFTGVINVTPALATATNNLARHGNVAGNGDTLLPGYTAAMVVIDIPDAEHVTVIANYSYQPMLFDTLPDFGFGPGASMQLNMQASVTVRAL